MPQSRLPSRWLLFFLVTLIPGPWLFAEERGAAAAQEGAPPEVPVEDQSIPLNPQDPSFYSWREMRDFSQDNRPPGPINIQRYPGGGAHRGHQYPQ